MREGSPSKINRRSLLAQLGRLVAGTAAAQGSALLLFENIFDSLVPSSTTGLEKRKRLQQTELFEFLGRAAASSESTRFIPLARVTRDRYSVSSKTSQPMRAGA